MKKPAQNEDYDAVHRWLRNQHGKANKCENPKCERKSTKFEWALMRGKAHDFRRGYYRQLCVPCHRIYDHAQNIRTLEQPQIISPRVLLRHREILKKASRKLKVSEAEIVRRALEEFAY